MHLLLPLTTALLGLVAVSSARPQDANRAAAVKPSLVLVPGAWSTPKDYGEISPLLTALGFEVKTVAFPSVGAVPAKPDDKADIAAVKATVQPLVEANKQVFVVVHSYGSVPASDAVKGLLVADRKAAGKQGGVAGIIYLTAFILPTGASLLDALGGQPLPWFNITDNGAYVYPNNPPYTPQGVFFGDLPKVLANYWAAQIQSQSYGVMSSPQQYDAYNHVPIHYLFCTRDQAIPLAVQQGMAGSVGAAGNGLRRTIGSDHFPQLSHPLLTTDFIRDATAWPLVTS